MNHTQGYARPGIKFRNPDAQYREGVELLARTGWKAWAFATTNGIDGGWERTNVWISDIEYTSTATKIMPIVDGSRQEMRAIWTRIINAARNYRWAEQNPNAGFVNWPRSLYKSWQSNSNTFVREMVRAGGITMVEMTFLHPGYNVAQQNKESDQDFFGNVTNYQFYAYLPPWRGGPGPPEP